MEEMSRLRADHAKAMNRGKFTTGSGLASYAKGRPPEDWSHEERDARAKRDKIEEAKEKINCKYGDDGDLWR